MSSTSFNSEYSFNKRRQNQDSYKQYNKENVKRSKSSDEKYKIDQWQRGQRKSKPPSFYRKGIDDEISTFIAKVSYLDTNPKVFKQEKAKQSLKFQNIHPIRIKQNDNDVEGHKRGSKLTAYNKEKELLVNNSSKNQKRKVDWKGQRSDSPHQRYHSNHNLHSNDYDSETQRSQSEERKPRPHSFKRRYKISGESNKENNRKHTKKVRVIWSKSRARSRLRRPKRLIRMGHRPRSRSDNSSHSAARTPLRQRTRSYSAISWIKYMPLKYNRKNPAQDKKSVKNQIFIKKREEIKKPFSFDSPTVITLFPQNKKEEDPCLLERSFLEDQVLPCKCFMCKKKYVQLIRLKHEIPEYSTVKKANEMASNCVKQQKIVYHSQIDHCCPRKCPKTWPYIPTPVIKNCISVYSHATYCNEDLIVSQKNVNFKFNSFRQCLDPKITEYFHSILEQINYC